MERILGGVFALLALSPYTYAQESYSPTAQYLAQRKAAGYSPGLTLEVLAQNPGAFKGRTVEIEGTVPGISPSPEGGAMIIFRTKGSGTLTLRMSSVPLWLQPGAVVRALCIITSGSENESVIGLPEMEIVAVASAMDINALEERQRQEQAQREQFQREQARQRAAQEAQRRAVVPVPQAPKRGSLASRSTTKTVSIGPPRYSDLSQAARSVFPAYRSFIKNHNKRLSDRQADEITFAILHFSEEFRMDPRLIVATVIAESDFKVQERSHSGAMGLIQLMPDEVRRLRLSNPYDPIQNIAGGIFLLKERLNKYSRSSNFEDASLEHIILTLASYNAGEGAVKKYGGVPPYRETQGYVKRIMALFRELTGQR